MIGNSKFLALKFNRLLIISIAFILVIILLFFLQFNPSSATPILQTLPPTPEPMLAVEMGDDECLECHQTPDMILPLSNGEQLYLTVNPDQYAFSIHGREGYACVQCHTDITGFPHPEVDFETAREFSIQMAESCANCHPQENEIYLEGDHAKTLQEGEENSAVCSDCHGSHQITEFGNTRYQVAKMCQQCHSEIYDVYRDSVHGAALIEEYDSFVPTCVDCHSNHSNAGPEERPEFHLGSIRICADCHTDDDLMNIYDINTDVFDTYLADFHGTTVAIFERTSPDQPTNKAVCIDCHGAHDIRSPDDVQSSVIKQNLITTCQRCHPEATINFPDSWLHHYTPDIEQNRIVFLVNLFYKIFVPGMVGGALLFILTYVWRDIKDKRNIVSVGGENESP